MTEQSQSRTKNVLYLVLTALYLVFALFPIFWMVLISLKSQEELFTTRFIFHPTFRNYMRISGLESAFGGTGSLSTDFPRAFMNSLLISTAAVIVSILVGIPAAYGLARLQFPGRENFAFTFLSFRFAPEFAVIIPLAILYKRLGLYDTYAGIVWVYQLITLPLIIWVLRGYFEDIPADLEYAALLDGYSRWRAFQKILLPLIRPGLAAAALLGFIFAWNNFVFALVLGSSNVQTVTVAALSFLASEQARFNEMAAASMISALPQVILALAIQRYLIRGLSFGAVKG